MAIVNVDNFTKFENEQSKSIVDQLLSLNKPYYLAVSLSMSNNITTLYFSGDSPMSALTSGGNFYIKKGTGVNHWINANGVMNQFGGTSASDSLITGFNSNVDILVRQVLISWNRPTVSLPSSDLGDILTISPMNYTVEDLDSDLINIVEKLDNTTLNRYSNVASGSSKTLDLSSRWDNIPYGKHTIDIIVNTSEEGSENVTTITFNKIKEPITTIPTNSTLTQAVNHMIELNKEIDYQETKLKTNLTDKGVEVLETDKMSNLIDKISDISIGIKYGEGVGSFLSGSGIASNWVEHTIITNLAFTPSKIVCFMPTVNISGSSYHAKRVAIDSDNCSALSPMVIVGYYEAYFYIGNITQNSFSIFFRGRASGASSPIEIRWYAYE